MRTAFAILLTLAPALADEPNMPVIPTEQQKITALKLAYQINGNSMKRIGSIDLTKPLDSVPWWVNTIGLESK